MDFRTIGKPKLLILSNFNDLLLRLQLATRFAQSAFYGVSARAGTARPAPGSAAWLNHHRRIHITIILAYLLYTIYEAYQSIQRAGDFYKALGVPHDVDEKGIKTRFRKLYDRCIPETYCLSSHRALQSCSASP